MKINDLPKDALVFLVDGDSIPYTLIHYLSTKIDDVFHMPELEEVNEAIDSYIYQLQDEVGCSHIAAFLGRGKCFRYEVAKTKPYKGNRPEKTEFHKKWSQYINQYLVDHFNFQYVDGIEADDAVAICAHQLEEAGINYLICSNDKDVDTVPGNHYSMNKREFYYISKEKASLLLHTQYITGDTTDNIPGLKNKGKAYAERLLGEIQPITYLENVEWAYRQYANKGSFQEDIEYFEEQKTLLTLLTSHENFQPEFHLINKIEVTPVNLLDLL